MDPEKAIKKWIPFVIGMIIIIFISVILFYQSVYRTAAATSRCKRLVDKYQSGAVYSVSEKSENGKPLYSVAYNLAANRAEHKCACPTGTILNKFYFTMRDLFNNNDRDEVLNCSCDDDYSAQLRNKPKETRLFEGYPELVDYMKNPSNDQFFRKPASVVFA